ARHLVFGMKLHPLSAGAQAIALTLIWTKPPPILGAYRKRKASQRQERKESSGISQQGMGQPGMRQTLPTAKKIRHSHALLQPGHIATYIEPSRANKSCMTGFTLGLKPSGPRRPGRNDRLQKSFQ